MTMRVGYLTYGLDRAPAGIGRYAVELLQALATLPDRPELVLLTTERADRHGLWEAFEHHHLPGCHLLPTLMTLGNVLLSQAIRRYRLDIVHDPNGIAPFLGSHAGAGRIATLHDAFAFSHPETHNWLDNWRYRWQLPYAARRADAIITVSACSRSDLTRYLGLPAEQVHVIAEGINPRFRPVHDDGDIQATLSRYSITRPYLLYIGGINARKNIARLFEAYAGVREYYPGIRLVIAGKRQWQTAEIDTTLRRLNLADHVYFTGYVADSDLPALYSAAEVFVFPSLYEGFGLPPLEALACGTPVVTSNVSALPEVVANAALTVDPYAVKGITAAILQILADADLRAELRRRGIERALQFNWQWTARETVAVYQRVQQKKTSGSKQENYSLY